MIRRMIKQCGDAPERMKRNFRVLCRSIDRGSLAVLQPNRINIRSPCVDSITTSMFTREFGEAQNRRAD